MNLTKHSRVLNAALMAAVALAAGNAARLHAQMLDLNGNGMSDIWEQVYGASGLLPSGDADGDGMSNLAESIAGTDPFDPNSVAKIPSITHSPTNFTVSMPCALGKQYQLQSLGGLTGGSNWVVETSVVARAGTTITLSAPATTSGRFYRVAISDVDPNGHGLNDWEEYKVGLDPTKASSNGQLDSNGQPMTDYAYVTNRLASQNVVTISATDPSANQPDPGQNPINLGVVTVSRGGFPLNSIIVNLGLSGPGPGIAVEGIDHALLPRAVTLPAGVSSTTITVTPLANTNRLSPAIATVNVLSGTGYSLGPTTHASVVIYPSATAAGTGLTGLYYTNSSATYANAANFNPANLKLVRVDPTVDYVFGSSATNPITSSGYYCVRWLGQVEPQYSETYYFDAYTDEGVKLWVNDQLIIDNWALHGLGDQIGTISLQGGTRYNLRLEYFNANGGSTAGAHLYWYSPSQSKQIIPSSQLYPTNSATAPTAVTSPLTAVAFLNQWFSNNVTAANTPLGYTATGVPAGLTFNPTNGVLYGYPSQAGDFQIQLTATNAIGIGASVLDLTVIDTGSAVTREVWLGVGGGSVTNIPLSAPANSTNVLATFAAPGGYADNYGERITGYFVPPLTTNYTFWVAGSDSLELWISNDQEPATKVRRAYVTAGGTPPNQWTVQPHQQSGWLSMVAGQKYYVEVLHAASSHTNDGWAVGWLQDPTGTNTTPAGTIPSYLLGRYFAPPPSFVPGTLYTANMVAQPGIASSGTGSATLRVSGDGSQAVLRFNYSGLTSAFSQAHIHCDAYKNLGQGTIIFDIDAAPLQPDGSYIWDIANSVTASPSDILEILAEGKAYLNIHTVNNPGGEINGHFGAVDGSPTFTPPPAPPAWTDDHTSSNAAARFLIQATFGPTPADVAAVQSLGYAGWLNNQFGLPVTHHLPLLLTNASADPTTPYPSTLTINTWWQQSVTAPDQLRQRVAFALSEIMVISQNGVLQNLGTALSSYYDTLLDNAFGNYRDLLKAVTLSPAMGLYLDMRGNDKGSIITGLHANENYAREIQQLFSIGLNRMWPDGRLVTDSQGNLVPTYNQNVIMGFAADFTGWNYYQTNQANGHLPANFSPAPNYTNPMALVPTHHDLGTKLLLDNVVLPQAFGAQTNSTTTNFDAYCAHDLESALDSIFYNQNVGPFICRQLIQRLVTSNPSRDYLYRVVQVFNDDGTGTRGNLQAVISAILLDYEARSPVAQVQPTFGKQREPLLRVTAPARAFAAPPSVTGNYSQSGTQTNTITTGAAHRLSAGDVVFVNFTDGSGNPAPPSQAYSVITVPSTTSFTVNTPGMLVCKYWQTNSTITVSNVGHGLFVGESIYADFTSGGAASGVYQVASVVDSSHFTVTTADSVSRIGQNCLIPKLTGGGYSIQSKTNLTMATTQAHGLNLSDSVFLDFTAAGSPTDGVYTVVSVPDPTHFKVVIATNNNTPQNGLNVLPLVAPPLTRSGTASINWNTWNVGFTDTGSSASLAQAPLDSPTVFNYFFPDYHFQGVLAAAGLTTPEFQLTSDTTSAWQMNYLEQGVLVNNNNTNGLSSFSSGNGAMFLDMGPWNTTNYTANAAGVGSLVDNLNTLLLAGQLSASARSIIVNYVTNTTNFGYSAPPTPSQVRDRVRAVTHLILTSPDYTIQK